MEWIFMFLLSSLSCFLSDAVGACRHVAPRVWISRRCMEGWRNPTCSLDPPPSPPSTSPCLTALPSSGPFPPVDQTCVTWGFPAIERDATIQPKCRPRCPRHPTLPPSFPTLSPSFPLLPALASPLPPPTIPADVITESWQGIGWR